MPTHDYVIDNQTAPNFRSDLNNALAAIVTQNSNATAPSVTYANMFWYDTANKLLRKRNEANSAWITLGTIDEGTGTFTPTGQPATQAQADWNTGTATVESTITPAKLDDKIENKLNVSGSAPIFACRAWVNFNGTGTVAIRASGNVSSITDNGTGNYTVNFTTAMQDADFATSALGVNCYCNIVSQSTSNVRIITQVNAGVLDSAITTVTVFR
jgi:hypothetical protein